MSGVNEVVQLVHQVVGYPTAFLLAPVALWLYRSPKAHRRFGIAYALAMVFLYATGLFMTLTRHEWWGKEFNRNLAFNFVGFWLLLPGWLAIHRYQERRTEAPRRLEWALTGVLLCGAIALYVTGRMPMRRIAMGVALLAIVDVVQMARGPQTLAVLVRRHVRNILASFYYVLTVASIVHLGAFDRKFKWLWPLGLAVLVIGAVDWALRQRGARRRRTLHAALGLSTAATAALLAYIVWAVSTGALDPFSLQQGEHGE